MEKSTLINIVAESDDVRWDYDEEADVLYLSVGEPVEALGTDIGGGIVVRYDEQSKQMVGLSITGIRSRLLEKLEADSGG